MNNKWILGIASLAIAFAVGFYALHFGDRPVSDNPSDWGPFGDFFGGILNPIIGGASLIALIATIKQNEVALEQAKEMISQGNSVINQNRQELIETRKEVRQAREAQQALADIEKKNLEIRKHIGAQENYEQDIKTRMNQIDSFLQMEVVPLHSITEKINFLKFFSNYETIRMKPSEVSADAVTVLKHIIKNTTLLCFEIAHSDHLTEHPNSQQLATIQKTRYGIKIVDIQRLTDMILINKGTRTVTNFESLLKIDKEFLKLANELYDSIMRYEISPYSNVLIKEIA